MTAIAKRQALARSIRRRGECSRNNLSHYQSQNRLNEGPSDEEYAIKLLIAFSITEAQVLTAAGAQAAAEKRAARSMQRDIRRQEARARRQARCECPAA